MLKSAPWLLFYKSMKTSRIEGVKGGATVCDLDDFYSVGSVAHVTDPPPAQREDVDL
jgi:hypothetical protein